MAANRNPKAAKAKGDATRRARGTDRTARTPENRKIIIEAIAAGMPKGQAWRLAGIAESTFYKWQAEDEGFALAMEQAFGRAIERKLGQLNALIATQQRGTITAIMFWLERNVPEFKYQSKTEITTGLSDEDRKKLEYVRELEEIDDDELAKRARGAKAESAGRSVHAHRDRERAPA